MRFEFKNKYGGPKTAVELWLESKTSRTYDNWVPSIEEQRHFDLFFGERVVYPPPAAPRLIQAAA